MKMLSAFQRDLLYIVGSLEEPHGLGVKEKLEGYYELEVNHGRLYPNLDTLVEKGLVDKTSHDNRTNCYSITEQGVSMVRDRDEWESEMVSQITRKVAYGDN